MGSSLTASIETTRGALRAAMDRYADGDASAFATVYDVLAPRLFAFLLRQTRDRARAEDLLQQTMLQIHAARDLYVRGSDVVPWAFAIARHALVSSRRRTRRELLFRTAEDEQAALEEKEERYDVPDARFATAELASLATTALSQIPEAHREAYTLIRQQGLTVAQAAEILGTTPTAVKLRAHRAYAALREALVEERTTLDPSHPRRACTSLLATAST